MRNSFKKLCFLSAILCFFCSTVDYSSAMENPDPNKDDIHHSQYKSLQSTMEKILESQLQLSNHALQTTPSRKSIDELSIRYEDLLTKNQRLEELVTLQLKHFNEGLTQYSKALKELAIASDMKIKELEDHLKYRMGRPGATVRKLVRSSYGNGYAVAYLMDDNTIRACGDGASHANGNSAAQHIFLPQLVSIDPEYSFKQGNPFKRIYAGYQCFFALTADGSVYSWGRNDYGALGHGDANATRYAKRIQHFKNNNIIIKDIIIPATIYQGHNSVYFLTNLGEVYAAGNNAHGQLGDGSVNDRSTPVRCGDLIGIKQLVASATHITSVYAIDGEGRLWSWGYNGQGQLGLGDANHRNSPVQVMNLPQGGDQYPLPVHKVAASAGYNAGDGAIRGFSMIIIGKERRLYCCGSNDYGQLGTANNAAPNVFTRIAGGYEGIQDIQAGGGYYGYSALLNGAGSLLTWGRNGGGELGLGDANDRAAPNEPLGAFQGRIKKFKLGGDHDYNFLVVLTHEGELWGTGRNNVGQLGLHNGMQNINRFQKLHQGIPPSQIKCTDFVLGGYGSNANTFAHLEDGRVLATGYNATHGPCGTHASNPHNHDAFNLVLF